MRTPAKDDDCLAGSSQQLQLQHLQQGVEPGLVDEQPLVSWFHALMQGREERRSAFTPQDLAGLEALGFSYVVLHQQGWPAPRWRRAHALLLESLGEPVIQQGSAWICWRLPGAE